MHVFLKQFSHSLWEWGWKKDPVPQILEISALIIFLLFLITEVQPKRWAVIVVTPPPIVAIPTPLLEVTFRRFKGMSPSSPYILLLTSSAIILYRPGHSKMIAYTMKIRKCACLGKAWEDLKFIPKADRSNFILRRHCWLTRFMFLPLFSVLTKMLTKWSPYLHSLVLAPIIVFGIYT